MFSTVVLLLLTKAISFLVLNFSQRSAVRNLSSEIFSSLRQLEYIENFAIRKKSVIYGIFVLFIIENPVQNLTV